MHTKHHIFNCDIDKGEAGGENVDDNNHSALRSDKRCKLQSKNFNQEIGPAPPINKI